MAKIKLKRAATAPGTKLDIAEPGYDTAAKKLYIGNGVGNKATAVASSVDLETNYPIIIDLT